MVFNREADEWQVYQKWLENGRVQSGIEEFLCFNGLDRGEDGDLDLNFCGFSERKKVSSSALPPVVSEAKQKEEPEAENFSLRAEEEL